MSQRQSVQPTGGTEKKVRMNVTFGPRTYSILEDLAVTSLSTKADVIRDALSLKQWVESVQDEGGKLLVEGKDGQIREVVITR